jgi:hypothetical protein
MTYDIQTFHDLLDAPCPVTVFDGVKNPKGKSIDKSFSHFLKRLSNIQVTDKKDTVLIVPCHLKDSRRSDQNVEKVSALVFDIDDPKGSSFSDLTALISPFTGIIHTTHSHRVDSPRYRVFLPLARQVSVEEWQGVRQGFLMCHPLLAGIIDPVCKDPSRGFYTYSAHPNHKEEAQFFVSMGKPLRPEQFLFKHSQRSSINNQRQPSAHQQLAIGGVKEGERNAALTRFLGRLIRSGRTQEETIVLVKEWNLTNLPPLDDEEVLAVHQNIWKRHLKNHNFSDMGDQLGSNFEPYQERRFEVLPSSVLLQSPPRPREYLIDGFVPEKIVMGLFAPGGAGKSMLTLATAVSVASGLPLFGTFHVKAPKRVVYISGEDDVEELQRRLCRMTDGLSSEHKTLIGQNLHFVDLADKFELFTEKPHQGETRISEVPEAIAKSIGEQVGIASLIIVDPASRFRGGEENSAGDTTRFVQALQCLRDQLQATVWLVHHVNKGARVNGANQNNARGSSALIDGLRLGYELNVLEASEVKKLFGDSSTNEELLTLRAIKSNYGKPIDPVVLKRCQDGTLAIFHQNPEDARKNNLLRAIQAAALTKTQFRDRYAGVHGSLGISEKALVRQINDLKVEGLILVPDRGVMTLTKAGESRLISHSSTGDERASL